MEVCLHLDAMEVGRKMEYIFNVDIRYATGRCEEDNLEVKNKDLILYIRRYSHHSLHRLIKQQNWYGVPRFTASLGARLSS